MEVTMDVKQSDYGLVSRGDTSSVEEIDSSAAEMSDVDTFARMMAKDFLAKGVCLREKSVRPKTLQMLLIAHSLIHDMYGEGCNSRTSSPAKVLAKRLSQDMGISERAAFDYAKTIKEMQMTESFGSTTGDQSPLFTHMMVNGIKEYSRQARKSNNLTELLRGFTTQQATGVTV
jgi:hypothetical protein